MIDERHLAWHGTTNFTYNRQFNLSNNVFSEVLTFSVLYLLIFSFIFLVVLASVKVSVLAYHTSSLFSDGNVAIENCFDDLRHKRAFYLCSFECRRRTLTYVKYLKSKNWFDIKYGLWTFCEKDCCNMWKGFPRGNLFKNFIYPSYGNFRKL